MSIDLEWDKLDESLSSRLVDVLNRQLANTTRPSFIGPIEVSSLDFGSIAPDIDLVDLRDIYRDFLEDDEDSVDNLDPKKETELGGQDPDEDFEWISRKAAVGRGEELFHDGYYGRQPFVQRGPTDMFASTPSLHSVGMKTMNLPGLATFRSGYSPAWATSSLDPRIPLAQRYPLSFTPPPSAIPSRAPPSPPSSTPPEPPLAVSPPALEGTGENTHSAPPNNQPNLQMHFHIAWHSDLRITLTTSLLINYPSPMFMSLPIKLSVTGLLFNGEVAVAYEGSRRRIHICVLDDLDPYGPAKRSPAPDTSSLSNSTKRHSGSSSTFHEGDEDSLQGHRTKPLPVGQRLLPSIYIESEIGQADKHVLKNVSRVEKFIQDVIRKTVEEELVFPNFHTLVMGDST
jgi:distribution and morphology protein 12